VRVDDKDVTKGKYGWQEFVKPQEDQIIDEFDSFESFVAVYLRSCGVSKILICDLDKNTFNLIGVGDEVGEITPGVNQNYKENKIRFTFSSAYVYDDLYEYDHSTGKIELIESNKLKGPEIIRENFVTEKIEAPADDGEAIPMTLFYKKGIKLDRTNKCLISGYGAYGLNMDMGFNIANIAAIERDWIIAMAHVRGGSEKGAKWHEEGKLQKKMNSINDFIA
jgi:oligopeptidase B